MNPEHGHEQRFSDFFLPPEGNRVLNERTNPQRLFIAVDQIGVTETNAWRSFYTPVSGGGYDFRTKICLGVPNATPGMPDKFAMAEVKRVEQKDEHQNTVKLSVGSGLEVECYINRGPKLPRLVVSAAYGPKDATDVYDEGSIELLNIYNEGDSIHSTRINYPALLVGRDLKLKGTPGNRPFTMSQDENRKICLDLQDEEMEGVIKIPTYFSLRALTNRLVSQEKLDSELLCHALSDYGYWDESFLAVNWAQEAGIEM